MLLFRQFVDEDLGCASYLVGDPSAGAAVVVDPAFEIDQYLAHAEPEHPFESLADGEEVTVGPVAVRVGHTPGHRPEHCAFVVDGRMALTGDSLLVGDAARPDLAVEARAGAADLFGSLHRLAELPPPTGVYPRPLA